MAVIVADIYSTHICAHMYIYLMLIGLLLPVGEHTRVHKDDDGHDENGAIRFASSSTSLRASRFTHIVFSIYSMRR